MTVFSDDELGMSRGITRRDFLDGVAVAAAGAAAAGALSGTASAAPHASYPPRQTGIRGQQPGSYDVGHAVRDGAFDPGRIRDTGESYDLVVVGGGLSGLAAAWFYRQAHGRHARILVLEALDDFGGHARRNEFRVRGRTLLSTGGTFNIDTPSTWTPVARRLLTDMRIDLDRLAKVPDYSLYAQHGLRSGTFFNREKWGTDRLVVRGDDESWESYAARMPMSAKGRADLVRLHSTEEDYYPGLSDAEKKDVLARISYERYLRDKVGVGDEAIEFKRRDTEGLWGVGPDRVSAADAWGVGEPGFDGLGLKHTPFNGIGRTPHMHLMATESDGLFYFPDGNSSLARLLVSRLVPGVFDGPQDMASIVTARADYGQLDRARSGVRIRLRSTAFDVRHLGGPGRSRGVSVAYSRDGRSHRVHARHVVMACWNSVSSYIVQGLPAEQVTAMRYGVKVPLLYARVAIRDWTSFVAAGLSRADTPSMYWSGFGLDIPTRLGRYATPRDPREPAVVTFTKTPNKAGLPCKDQHKAGRVELIRTPFETFEREIRDVLARGLGGYGFDPARDISAITVNRWAHGYAYEYNSLDDPAIFKPAAEQPYTLAGRTFGRVAIANSDAGAFGYTHEAIDQAYRAVSR
ncbi:MAG TPA: NAD(P)-binding protein [Thermomonospora sp.]|nr:NAD(P)-binding protein [Thermomonospora sp.]